ncbi:SGNH hydrolase domain-containing protein [Nocardioides aequoreus]|uniref:SGNH hydrolase domain-containing protein n=1 Tax=Nocardioides aequoreus TaxID=397278 RepID=UPI0012F6D6AD|nr:SGNH hydrolase domain-containing protein [Nocardioides aequoreus]
MHLIDLTAQICDAAWCYPVVGDVIVYRDGSHLSAEYATMLAPYLGDAFDDVDVRPER